MNHKWKSLIPLALLLAFSFGGCSLLQQEPGKEESSAPVVSQEEEEVVPKDVFAEGTLVDGVDLSGKTLPQGIALCQDSLKSKLAAVNVTVNIDGDKVKIKGAELSYTDVVEELLTQIYADEKPGTFDLSYTLNSDQVLELLEPTAKEHVKEAKNATVDSFDGSGSFTFTEAVDGVKIDLSDTVSQVMELLSEGKSGTVKAPLTRQPAAITADVLEKKYTRLASFSTVSQNNENGNHNMALAFERISGTVLEPGEEFSFNNIVGDSTYDGSGFLPAGGLMNGVLVPMYGGGICQASSTIYGAALRAGMEITLRDCHSSPSTYVPMGLDATVSYSDLDFRFVNPYDYPVYLVGYMDDVTLTFSIYGCQPDEWDSIEVNSWESGQEPVPDGVRYITSDSMEKGEYELKSSGNIGYYAAAERIYYKDGDVVRTEELSSSYYAPMEKTYLVGPGTDTSKVKGDSGNTE